MTSSDPGASHENGGWVLLTFVYISVAAWLAMVALFSLAREHGELGVAASLGVTLLGFVPLLGHAAGAIAATMVWGWDPAVSLLVFFGFVFALMPSWAFRRRQLRPRIRDLTTP